MRVVHLASSAQLGGAEWVILDIIAGLRAAHPEFRQELIVPDNGPLAVKAAAIGIDVTVIPLALGLQKVGDAMATRSDILALVLRALRVVPGALGYARRLRTALRRAAPTILHAHGFKMHLLGMWVRPLATPVVLHLHDYTAGRLVVSRLLRMRVRGVVVAAAISRSVADDAREVLPRSVEIFVVHNGIDTDAWTPDGPRTDLDALAGLDAAPSRILRVGLVATMARWKGHDVFLRAMALLPHDREVRGYVVGGPIYETERSQHDLASLKASAETLGLGGRVGFTGFVADPASAMRSLDIVVHASTRPEPFGRVIVEGMSLERAVIVSAAGGAVELIVPGETALDFVPGRAEDLAARITELLRDPRLRARLGAAGRQHVRQHFSRASMASAVADIYRRAAAA